MRPSSRSTDTDTDTDVDPDDPDDRGSAALEFILVGLLMLVPLVYLVVALGSLQQQSLGAEAGARHLARAISTAADAAEADARAERVLASVRDEYGLDDVEVDIACRPAGVSCPAAGATLIVTVRSSVTLPLVPPVLGLDQIASIPVEGSAAHKVSRFWGAS